MTCNVYRSSETLNMCDLICRSLAKANKSNFVTKCRQSKPRRILGRAESHGICAYSNGMESHLRRLVDDADVELSPLEDRVVGAQARGGHHRLTDRVETSQRMCSAILFHEVRYLVQDSSKAKTRMFRFLRDKNVFNIYA